MVAEDTQGINPKNLVNAVILAEERERREIAVDIHDTIAQLLTASLIHLDLTQDGKVDTKSCISSMRDGLTEASDLVRALTFRLCPPILYACGLKDALAELAERVTRDSALKVIYKSTVDTVDLSKDSLILIYSAVRELIMNVVKHAEATEALLTISISDGVYKIEVKDDGKGFDLTGRINSADSQDGLGLIRLRESMAGLGCVFEIVSEPGVGTRASMLVKEDCYEG